MKTIPIEAIALEISSRVAAYPQLLPVGSRSKAALSHRGDYELLSLEPYAGILEYQPSEYTFTALAGTRLDTIESMLAEHGQFLPFDPPMVEAGATLGGTVAAGLSGSGRYRYGGVRDFLLGVKYIDFRFERGARKVGERSAPEGQMHQKG